MKTAAIIAPIKNEVSGRLTAAKARQVLLQNGLQVNDQQAAIMLEFLFKIGTITIKIKK